MRSGLFDNCELVALKLGQRHRGHLDHHVDATREHFGHAGVRVGDRAEHHGLKRGRAIPVIGVGLDHDSLVGAPFREGERAGAGRVAAELGPVLHHRRRRDDQAGGIGEVGQERRVGFA